ncbi:LysE family translocator [Paracidovorax avenae]|uniref:LysE family translocator n=1 Tax=Paracidovorax avenae TaxID=80867 RepID=UPI000D21CA9C|nr:LysE family transporter [Paracidovorax avenae]AVS97339.1 lysine transporter LysE [Paracidovorax avenae]AVT10887.1 lysine transporter LysE [Paracidovorax avenae]
MALLDVFLPSLVIGLSIAAPVGPIGILVIQRSLAHGPRAGLATGLGAAAADAVYGALGAYGVHWLVHALVAVRVPLVWAGAAFLLWMAWQIARAPAAGSGSSADDGTGPARSSWIHFARTFALTLSNPATILSFIAVFGAMAGRSAAATTAPAAMVAGVFAGSALWWLCLSMAVGLLRARFDARWHRRIHRASAAVLAAFALWQVASV